MDVVIVEDWLVLILFILFKIENIDSLLSNRSNVPLSFINRITAFRTVNYFVRITATVQFVCIKMIESESTSA